MANIKEANTFNPDHDRSKLGKVVNPSVTIKVGKKLSNYLKTQKDAFPKVPQFLSVPQIKSLLVAINEEKKLGTKPQNFSLRDLMSDADILIPQLVVPERNPELDKRVERLKYQLAEKEYQRMTQNVNFSSRYNPEDSIGTELRKMNTGLIAVFQFIVTVGAAFLFGFMGLEVFLGYSFELAIKLLLGIVFALVVAAAELYFLVMNMDFDEKDTILKKTPTTRPQFTSDTKKTN